MTFYKRSGKRSHTQLYDTDWRKRSHSVYTRQVYAYQLRNIEDGTVIVYYTNRSSSYFDEFSKAEAWL